MSVSDDPTTEQLRAVQAEREHDERERAQAASTGVDERAARRRAEKAGYLRSKLDEQASSEEP